MSFPTVNPDLIKIASGCLHPYKNGQTKRAFVPAGDPSMGGGGGGGGDPSGGGGGDPSGGGGDPAAGAGGGAGGGDAMASLQPMIQNMVQQAMMQGGGGMGGGMQGGMGAGGKNPLTPKIDEKAVMLQMLKILARIADHLKIPIPASEMVVNQNDMMGLAQASSSGGPLPGIDPTAGGGAAGGAGGGAIGGMDPMSGMQPAGTPGAEKTGQARPSDGSAFSGFEEMGNRASAIARLRGVNR